MERFLSTYKEHIFAVARILIGLMFFMHGLQKFGILHSFSMELNPMLITAAVIEIVGGAMIVVGLYARWAAFISSGLMAVAYFMVHASGGNVFLPLASNAGGNGGESAIFYCWFFLYLAARGAGIWSVDAAQGRS